MSIFFDGNNLTFLGGLIFVTVFPLLTLPLFFILERLFGK